MPNANTPATSAIGLDVGTSRIVAAYREDKGIRCDTQLNAFVTIPFSKLTQGVLKKERIPHLVQDSEITVYGDESERFANLFHKETREIIRLEDGLVTIFVCHVCCLSFDNPD